MKFRFVKILACGLLAGVLAVGGSGVASVTAYAYEWTVEDEAYVQDKLQKSREAGRSEEWLKSYEQDLRRMRANSRAAELGDTSPAGEYGTKLRPDVEVPSTNPSTVVTNPAIVPNDNKVVDNIQASDNVMFDAQFYAQTYPEVVAILGTDYNVLYNHYIMYGKAEGRRACAADVQQPVLPDGTVFDAQYYAQTNPDVVAVFGTNADALYTHYVMFGKAEGRKACGDNMR